MSKAQSIILGLKHNGYSDGKIAANIGVRRETILRIRNGKYSGEQCLPLLQGFIQKNDIYLDAEEVEPEEVEPEEVEPEEEYLEDEDFEEEEYLEPEEIEPEDFEEEEYLEDFEEVEPEEVEPEEKATYPLLSSTISLSTSSFMFLLILAITISFTIGLSINKERATKLFQFKKHTTQEGIQS